MEEDLRDPASASIEILTAHPVTPSPTATTDRPSDAPNGLSTKARAFSIDSLLANARHSVCSEKSDSDIEVRTIAISEFCSKFR